MDTKLDLIQGAYSQMRISGLTVQPTPEDTGLALMRLEDMMEELNGRGLCLGFNFETNPKVTSPHGLQRKYRHMAQTNLAVRCVPDFNKTVPQILYSQAAQAYSAVSGMVAIANIREVQPPDRMPVGSGHRYRSRYQRFFRPEPLAPNDCYTTKMVVGEINDFEESFADYLEGDTIASYVLDSSDGITTSNDSNTDEIVSYRVEATTAATTHHHVRIEITTNTGRVEVRLIDFEIKPNSVANGLA